MATMSMNKAIHGAFRRDLDRFVRALETFPAGDSARAAQLGRAWDNLDAQLTDHHEGEHAIAWPHLERAGVAKDLLDTMDAEHAVMAEALGGARTAMGVFREQPTAEHAAATRAAIEDLRTATVAHLDHEEAEIETFYLEHADHPEIRAMGREFGKRSPSFAGRFFAWVADGATPEQDAAIRGNVPRPVFAVLSGVWGRSYRRDIAPVWR